jgi:23S rRNA pseudouridine955/2504/2580 synthase/23S rRNA pseudouridine1911/1915/1917 synthase
MSRKESDLHILHDDSDLVAIDKPPGIAAIPGRDESLSIIEILGKQLHLPFTGATDPRLRVVHRIDKDTSGVLLFAKNSTAQRHLSHQFQNNTVRKEYLALVAGRPAEDQGEIDAPIGPHPTSPKRMAVLKHGGRPARTLWKVEARFRDYALLRVFPQTGKTHQIRVHLAHIGLPLAIDPLYHAGVDAIFLSGFKRDYRLKLNEPERPLMSRLTLHAEKLRFGDGSGQHVEIISHLPKDFRAAINQLARHNR